MGGQTRIDVGICRVWVYLDSEVCRKIVLGGTIAAAITGLYPDPTLITKIIAACSSISSGLIAHFNHGKGVIVKLPHLVGIIASRPSEIVSQ
jgi:hypothetical protein